jgi:hypothetical protein
MATDLVALREGSHCPGIVGENLSITALDEVIERSGRPLVYGLDPDPKIKRRTILELGHQEFYRVIPTAKQVKQEALERMRVAAESTKAGLLQKHFRMRLRKQLQSLYSKRYTCSLALVRRYSPTEERTSGVVSCKSICSGLKLCIKARAHTTNGTLAFTRNR